MIGIKSNRADLKDYNAEYEVIAKKTINVLKSIIGNKAEGIEHVGSTAIIGIKSKPIIDIVIGVNSLRVVDKLKQELEENGIMYAKVKLNNTAIAFKCEEDGRRTHNIYFVIYNGERWKEFVWFRDCLNANHTIAKEYEKLKIDLSEKYSDDVHQYTECKSIYISEVVKKYAEQLNIK